MKHTPHYNKTTVCIEIKNKNVIEVFLTNKNGSLIHTVVNRTCPIIKEG